MIAQLMFAANMALAFPLLAGVALFGQFEFRRNGFKPKD